MFTLMCDAHEITTFEYAGTPNARFVLRDGVPRKYVPFGLFKNKNYESAFKMIEWFSDRAFPEDRVDCNELLEELGLERYDPWEIVKITRATLMTDYFWLKVEDSDTYEEFSLRGAAGIPSVEF